MKTTVHIVSHSHWDREWYLPFEKHRMHLVELVDAILEKFETDEEYRSFFLDGQTIALDDYLEIRPQKREQIEKYVREGRLCVGPWYVLQDEFLTSGESCVRNLLTGMESAKKYGKVSHIGYFPDAFGNAGQMPQVLKQAKMEAIAFGRGVKPIGLNNEIKSGQYESTFSEMNWQSNDGSSLPGILFANWYNNGMEIPVDETEAKIYWDERLAKARQFAGTSHLLLMNGCDHQPVQKNLSEAILVAKKLYPDIEFIHSDLETYAKAVKEELSDKTSTVIGELTSQETDGCWTLVNTCSANADLKIANRKGESALERQAEPAAAVAFLLGDEYPADLLSYSWKKLMQNHPHDSICGCSVDEVNREIETRFHKSLQVAEELYKNSLRKIADKIDTQSIYKDENHSGKRKIAFAVCNFSGWVKTQVVSVMLDAKRLYGNLEKSWNELEAEKLPEFTLYDAEQKRIAAKITKASTEFGYDLPTDRFRQPYMAERVQVTFEAEDVPAMGYKVYVLEENEECLKSADCQTENIIQDGENILKMENKFISVQINEDGSYDLTDKKTGYTFKHIGIYEDTGDMGNEYIYIQDTGRKTITTANKPAKITVEENSELCSVVKICQQMEIPEAMGDEILAQRYSCVDPYQRQAKRSTKLVLLELETKLTLERSTAGLKVQTTIVNTAKDHRVRVLIPTGLVSDMHMADSPFEVVRRPNRHGKAWINPSGCEHQQCFVAMEDSSAGILAANRGLYEYEILPDQENAIALTLLRSVAEMGDWGYFPTPQAQMQGTYTMEYALFPYEAGKSADAFVIGYGYQHDLAAVETGMNRTTEQIYMPQAQTGILPLEKSFFEWQGEGLNLTAWKKGAHSDDIFVRFVNTMEKDVTLTVKKADWMKCMYRSNVIEEENEALPEENEEFLIVIKPYEIATFGMKLNKQ